MNRDTIEQELITHITDMMTMTSGPLERPITADMKPVSSQGFMSSRLAVEITGLFAAKYNCPNQSLGDHIFKTKDNKPRTISEAADFVVGVIKVQTAS
jgi:hypothetical protein